MCGLRRHVEGLADSGPGGPSSVRCLDVLGGEAMEGVGEFGCQLPKVEVAHTRLGLPRHSVLSRDSLESSGSLFEQFRADLRRGG